MICKLYLFVCSLLLLVLADNTSFAGVFLENTISEKQLNYSFFENLNCSMESRLIALDSTTTDSVTTEEAETRVIRTKSSKDDLGHSKMENSFVLDAGFPLSDLSLQYGLTFRGYLIGFGYYLALNRFSYSRVVATSSYVYDQITGSRRIVDDTSEKSFSVTTLGYGFFGSSLIAKKIDLVYSIGLMVNATDLIDVFPPVALNLSLEGAYFFTKQLAAGINTRGIFLLGEDSRFIVAPGAMIKVVF